MRSLQAADHTTWAKHIVLKAVASVEEGRPITRTHVIYLSDEAEELLPQGIRMHWSTGQSINFAFLLPLMILPFLEQKAGTPFLHRCGLPYANSRG